MGVKDFRELEVWRLSMDLVERVYALIRRFPEEERYALCSQLRRAVVSIPSNIAEGFGRDTHRDFARFLVQARGSLYEVGTQLEIAVRLGYCDEDEDLKALQGRVSRALGAFVQYLNQAHIPVQDSPSSGKQPVLSFGVRHPAPVTPHPAPSTRHQAPGTRHQAPGTKHQAP